MRRTINFSNFSLSVSEANCAASHRLAPYSAAGSCRESHVLLVRSGPGGCACTMHVRRLCRRQLHENSLPIQVACAQERMATTPFPSLPLRTFLPCHSQARNPFEKVRQRTRRRTPPQLVRPSCPTAASSSARHSLASPCPALPGHPSSPALRVMGHYRQPNSSAAIDMLWSRCAAHMLCAKECSLRSQQRLTAYPPSRSDAEPTQALAFFTVPLNT